MARLGTGALMARACENSTVIPAFNIPYIPMMEPVVRAVADTGCLALIAVARLEWEKFEAISTRAIYEEYERVKDERFTRLHLDHVPVVDEDKQRVDFASILSEAAALGYDSLMVDGSRLPLAENIVASRQAAELARAAAIPIEAELGAVLGHEEGPLPPYEELFRTGRGFTDVAEAVQFVAETGVDWLSVAIGNVHGAISAAKKQERKVAARLDVAHLARIRDATCVPLVLHGGSGIPKEYVRAAITGGIAKINVGTAIRQPYERLKDASVLSAQDAVYEAVLHVIRNELAVEGSAETINPAACPRFLTEDCGPS